MSDFAFPNDMPSRHGGDNLPFTPGLTKRELFAAMAMQGMCASESEADGFYRDDALVKKAVSRADALLAELTKEKP